MRIIAAAMAIAVMAGCATQGQAPKASSAKAISVAAASPKMTPTRVSATASTAQARGSAAQMKTNAAGLAIIKEAEGLRLKAYSDGQRWLIGYGHTATAKKGMVITEARAEALLKQDLASFEKSVATAVKVPVTLNEFSAMASLCYNIGGGNFAKSDVVAKLNAGDRQGAADAFRTHNKGTIKGVRQAIPRLSARREKERALFLTR